MPIAPQLLQQVANPPVAQAPDFLTPATAVFDRVQKSKQAKQEFQLRKKKFDLLMKENAEEAARRKKGKTKLLELGEKWSKSESARVRDRGELAKQLALNADTADDITDGIVKLSEMKAEDGQRQFDRIHDDALAIADMNDEQLTNWMLANDVTLEEQKVRAIAQGEVASAKKEREQELQQKVEETRLTTRASQEEQERFEDARLTEFKANEDITLPNGKTVRSGETFRLDQNNPAHTEFATNAAGSITRIGVAGASAQAGDFGGSKAAELSDALESGEASNLLRGFTELGGGVSGLRGEISEHVGGPVGQVFGPDAERAFTQFVSNADPHEITNWRTRARSFVTRQVTEFTAEESGRITKAELDLTKQAQKVVDDPSPSTGQVRAALTAVIELKEMSRLKNRLMRGEQPRFDLTTKEGLNEYGNLLLEKQLTKPEAEAMIRRMQTIQREGLSTLGGFVKNG